MRTIRTLLAASALTLAVAAPRSAQAQLAPWHNWRTLETKHFHVHVRAGLEREARAAAAVAERAYEQLSGELAPPRGGIDLVLADDADYSNGNATPFPSNRIVIYATPPIETQSLRFNDDWLRLVITHELTHIFHLDRTRGIWSLAQLFMGRGPDLFPNLYGPSWLTEGLAVYYESRFTEGGRLKDSEHRLLAQTSALEHQLPQLDALSLSTPLFPNGERAYGYGSLLVEYLARSRGDTTIRKLVDIQARAIIPYRLNHESQLAFGISFKDAFKVWRDSVQLSAGASRPPLPAWRELTAHAYYATDPRWLNDSTLIYAASDGRNATAAYRLSLNGTRQSLGRRNSLGASVPLADGSLLFAQLEITAPNVVRSDLFIQHNGKQRQFTHGMRLVQPDASRSGDIVAVQYGANRTSLVLLDANGKLQRVLRDAGADETWSEPRWSPAGSMIVAAHRTHGGTYSIEVLDLATGDARAIDRGNYLISAPSWSPDGASVLYVSEASGTPLVMRRSIIGEPRTNANVASASVTASENVATPEVSPNGLLLAAATLRANGFHLGVAPLTGLALSSTTPAPPVAAPIDSEPLAPGDFHPYHAWRSLFPHYWYPVVEEAPGRGTRLGAKTTGSDVLGRHAYSAYLTVPTTGSFPTAGFAYHYAGFRQPVIDADVFQDYTLELTLKNGGTTNVVGYVLRQVRDASLAATFVRPRIRTYSSFSVGIGAEHRAFLADPAEFLKQVDPGYSRTYMFPRAFVSAQWSNTQRPLLSISPEDGISLAVTARERARSDSIAATTSTSVVGTASLFKSLDLPGFAHHVLAVRLAAGAADNHASTSFEVGGISGGNVEIFPGYVVGETRRTFGVRGFPAAAISGTRALAAQVEYRLPALLGGRGLGSLPFFFDRSSITAFADAANASCGQSPRFNVCSPVSRIGRTIASVGSEAVLSGTVISWDVPQTLRFGFAVPVAGRDIGTPSSISGYVGFGLSF
ncbi:MAG: hypothetical protein ABJE47_23765 [bacterium]